MMDNTDLQPEDFNYHDDSPDYEPTVRKIDWKSLKIDEEILFKNLKKPQISVTVVREKGFITEVVVESHAVKDLNKRYLIFKPTLRTSAISFQSNAFKDLNDPVELRIGWDYERKAPGFILNPPENTSRFVFKEEEFDGISIQFK